MCGIHTILALCCYVVVTLICAHESDEVIDYSDDGGWTTGEGTSVGGDGPCNIEKHDAHTLTRNEFLHRYAYSEPVIIRNIDNRLFRQLSTRERLLHDFGDVTIQLSSANTYSYHRVTATFGEYVKQYMRPQNLNMKGNETFYLFGDIDRNEWDSLLKHYRQPTDYVPPTYTTALSFGVAGAGTGVPFHVHGPGFAEVIYGRKRWFLYAPGNRPIFDPDTTTLKWFMEEYPNLVGDKRPYECVMNPGEVIYFPDMWWHATLNVDTSVFVSTFLSNT